MGHTGGAHWTHSHVSGMQRNRVVGLSTRQRVNTQCRHWRTHRTLGVAAKTPTIGELAFARHGRSCSDARVRASAFTATPRLHSGSPGGDWAVEVIKEYEDAEKGEVLACFEALTSLRSLLMSKD